MSILFDAEQKLFHLQTVSSSYVMKLSDQNDLLHLYYGKKLTTLNGPLLYTTENFNVSDSNVNLDIFPQEYPSYGTGDYRTPAYEAQRENGSTVSELKYVSHSITKGKPVLSGLPATYVEQNDESETLQILLKDAFNGLEVTLSYTAYEAYSAITRSCQLRNSHSTEKLTLRRAMSMSLDFESSDYDFFQLSGAWARERHIYRQSLRPGLQAVDSKRGYSSFQQAPFIALLEKHTTEDCGDAFGFDFIYSGNFLSQVEVDQFHSTRVSIGINPFDFAWVLEPSESFQTPEVVMVYSANGLGEMSRTYHDLYRKRLCRTPFRDQERPILANNWQATYFDFTADKILEIAKASKEVGVELFVLDDGWFGKRDSDNCSLGDWTPDPRKLPNGLSDLVNKVTEEGIAFGLWFEPEMVSPDSDLYRAHPDWCVHVPERTPMAGPAQRNQLVLDLTRQDVRDAIVTMVCDVLKSCPITYVKWDMNRAISDMGSPSLTPERQREFAHRYVLGLYDIMDRITSQFPHILFESCSSGGCRFDGGILYYMPQTWTSDNTDAVERLKIQYGTSMIMPAITMGSHISCCPNHQVWRSTPLKTRGHLAMSGRFGYEIDMTKFEGDEKELVKEQITFYKTIRPVVQFGDFYRLLSPFEGKETAWMYVAKDQSSAVAFYFKPLAEPNVASRRVKLKGLAPDACYQLAGTDLIATGEELMYVGIDTTKLCGDYASICWHFNRI